MLDSVALPDGISRVLSTICTGLKVPVALTDPDLEDTPLVYVNGSFERLTQWSASEIMGRNLGVLHGPLTDRQIVEELALSAYNHRTDCCCLISYRKDGSLFFDVQAMQAIHVTRHRTLMMSCHFAFTPTQSGRSLSETGAVIDMAQRQVRLGTRSGPNPLNIHDTYRLDTLVMRAEAAFIRVRNSVVKSAATQMREEQRYPYPLPSQPFGAQGLVSRRA